MAKITLIDLLKYIKPFLNVIVFLLYFCSRLIYNF